MIRGGGLQRSGGGTVTTPPQRTFVPAKPANSSIVTTFAAGHGFTELGGTGAGFTSFADDSTQGALGGACLKVETKSNNTAGSTQNTALSVDATGQCFRIWAKIDDTTSLTEFILYAANDSSFASFYQWTLMGNDDDSLKWFKSGEWAAITLSFGDAAVTGSPTRNSLGALRLRVRTSNGASTTVRFGGIGMVAEQSTYPDGVVSITFDDLYTSQYTVAKAYMDKYGFPGTMYGVPSRAHSGAITTAQLLEMEDLSGWEIGGHGLLNIATLTAADRAADLLTTKRWLLANGFRGVDHYSYPNGGYTQDIAREVGQMFASARTIVSRTKLETVPPADPRRLRAYTIAGATTVSQVTDVVDLAVTHKAWCILVFHDLATPAPGAVQWPIENFEDVIDHIANSGVAVRTVGDVLRGI